MLRTISGNLTGLLSGILITLLFSTHARLSAQESFCALDIGGEDVEIIIQIFQLNEEQQSLLESWRAELQLQTRVLEDEMKQLLATHPQSTEADLQNLARKYGLLKNQLLQISSEYDQRLLGVFNEKQYKFYTELCREAMRTPLNPIPREEEEKEDP